MIVQNLRSNVPRGSTIFKKDLVVTIAAQPEIRQNNLILIGNFVIEFDQNIIRFDIAMGNVLFSQSCQTFGTLLHYNADLVRGQSIFLKILANGSALQIIDDLD